MRFNAQRAAHTAAAGAVAAALLHNPSALRAAIPRGSCGSADGRRRSRRRRRRRGPVPRRLAALVTRRPGSLPPPPRSLGESSAIQRGCVDGNPPPPSSFRRARTRCVCNLCLNWNEGLQLHGRARCQDMGRRPIRPRCLGESAHHPHIRRKAGQENRAAAPIRQQVRRDAAPIRQQVRRDAMRRKSGSKCAATP